MQIFLPLILITVLLNILTAPDNLHAAVTGQTIQPDNFCINQISEIPVQKAILKDSSAAFTHVNHYLIDLKEKETWIRETAIKLNQLSGPAEEQYIEKQVTDMEGYYQAGYRLQAQVIFGLTMENGYTWYPIRRMTRSKSVTLPWPLIIMVKSISTTVISVAESSILFPARKTVQPVPLISLNILSATPTIRVGQDCHLINIHHY
jgi:hypothetical protein